MLVVSGTWDISVKKKTKVAAFKQLHSNENNCDIQEYSICRILKSNMFHVKEKYSRKVEWGFSWWKKTAVLKIKYGVSRRSPPLDYDIFEGRNHVLFIFMYPGLSLVPGTWSMIINSFVLSANIYPGAAIPPGAVLGIMNNNNSNTYWVLILCQLLQFHR